MAPLLTSLDNRMSGRRFFTSGDTLGIMGLGPARAKLRDHICLLMGCDIPILLRSEGDHFVLVGEAYIHGFMQGEAESDIQNRKLRLLRSSQYTNRSAPSFQYITPRQNCTHASSLPSHEAAFLVFFNCSFLIFLHLP